jgi:hypothetical protein
MPFSAHMYIYIENCLMCRRVAVHAWSATRWVATRFVWVQPLMFVLALERENCIITTLYSVSRRGTLGGSVCETNRISKKDNLEENAKNMETRSF